MVTSEYRIPAGSRRLLLQWLHARTTGDEIYEDAEGRVWDINDLRRRATSSRVVDLAALWHVMRALAVWGESNGALQDAHDALIAREWHNATIASLIDRADSSKGWTAHLARIALFVRSVEAGVDVPPMIVGPDGLVWDGHHRLVALVLCGKDQVAVRYVS